MGLQPHEIPPTIFREIRSAAKPRPNPAPLIPAFLLPCPLAPCLFPRPHRTNFRNTTPGNKKASPRRGPSQAMSRLPVSIYGQRPQESGIASEIPNSTAVILEKHWVRSRRRVSKPPLFLGPKDSRSSMRESD